MVSAPHEKRDTPQLCYTMAYFILPQYAADRPRRLIDMLSMGPRAGAAFFYAMTCQLENLEPRDDVVRLLAVHEGGLADARKYHIIEYPTPTAVDITTLPDDEILDAIQNIVLAPHFSAIIHSAEDNSFKYFVLGQSTDGGTTLRSVADGVNANLGPGCEPSVESFVALLENT